MNIDLRVTPYPTFRNGYVPLDILLNCSIIKRIMTADERIAIDPKVRFGKPTIRGTRIAIADILSLLAGGYTITDIPKQYPGITREDVLAALEFTTDILESPAKILHRVAVAHTF